MKSAPQAEVGEALYRRLKTVQREFGLARMELGMLLEVFKTNEDLWRGRAQSFGAFLEEERIHSAAAAQFMKVAKCFVIDMALSNSELADIATANWRILEVATRIITPENRDDVLAILSALGEKDARAALEDFEANKAPLTAPRKRAKAVDSVMRKYRDLPQDQQIDFLREVAPRKHEQRSQTART